MNVELQADNRGRIDPSDFTLSFATRSGNPIRYYDDGIGPLWVFRDSLGIVGIVRAQTERDAYSIVEDEFLPVVPREELHDAYGCYDLLRDELIRKGHPDTIETRRFAIEWAPVYFELCGHSLDLIEGYSYQSNSTGTGVVAHDLNGEMVELLTPELIDRLEIKVTIKCAT